MNYLVLCSSVTVQQSIHGSLRNQGVSTSGVPYVTGSDGFTVQEVTKVIWCLLYKIRVQNKSRLTYFFFVHVICTGSTQNLPFFHPHLWNRGRT